MNSNKYYITKSYITCYSYSYSYVIIIIVYQTCPKSTYTDFQTGLTIQSSMLMPCQHEKKKKREKKEQFLVFAPIHSKNSFSRSITTDSDE